MLAVAVLLVDDSEKKVRRIEEAISCERDCRVEWTVVRDLASARRAVRARQFDVMILDIAMPIFPGEGPRARAGLDFLKEITLDDDYLRPTYIVGITEQEESFEELRSEFESRAWPLYKCDQGSASWIDKIRALLGHVSHSSTRTVRKVDFAIITALYDPEFTALLGLPCAWSQPEQLDEATLYRSGSLEVGERRYSVVATWPQRMGLVLSAALVTKMILTFRPRVVAASGICAGVRGKTELGDLVLASEAWTWESGKIVSQPVPGTLQPDPHAFSASTAAVTVAQRLQGESAWLTSLRDEWKASDRAPESQPRLIIAPMASGSAVVADETTVANILSKSRKTVAIDMEAYAVYAAAAMSGQPLPVVFCVKGVCDFADQQKNDSYQKFAAHVSARAVQRICAELATTLAGF